MKVMFDPQHFDLPVTLAYHIAGAFVSGLGILATTVYGCYHKLAVISPEELALQPLHVVLIAFIIALGAFVALICRAVWGKGLSTMNRIADSLDNFGKTLITLNSNITEMRKDQEKSIEKYQDLSLDALKGAAKASKKQ